MRSPRRLPLEISDLGLLKMDFLGLKTLTVIRNTCEMVKATKGIAVPIDSLPLDDPATYDLLNKANTLGIFQLESGGCAISAGSSRSVRSSTSRP